MSRSDPCVRMRSAGMHTSLSKRHTTIFLFCPSFRSLAVTSIVMMAFTTAHCQISRCVFVFSYAISNETHHEVVAGLSFVAMFARFFFFLEAFSDAAVCVEGVSLSGLLFRIGRRAGAGSEGPSESGAFFWMHTDSRSSYGTRKMPDHSKQISVPARAFAGRLHTLCCCSFVLLFQPGLMAMQ